MVQFHVPPFLDWEILQGGAESQWGFTPLKSSGLESPWPCVRPHLCLLSASWDPFLHSLPFPCSLGTGAASTRQHNSNQGCFKVSTVQAQQVAPEQHANSSPTWPFLFLPEKEIVLGVWGLGAIAVSDHLFMQARQIHLWMLFQGQDLTLD